MLGAFSAPRAKLQKLYLPFNFLLVLLAPVIDALAGRAGELDEAVLAHVADTLAYAKEKHNWRAHSDLHGELCFWRAAFYY